MSGLARRRRLLSQEAAVKYFLLGAFASGFFLYGLALVYGATGTVGLPGINRVPRRERRRASCSSSGWGCSSSGCMFKASVAPFHTWTPDVYQGAPTPVTAFMAACTKVAAFGAILRVLYVGVRPGRVDVAAADLRHRDRVDGGRRGARAHPDRPQADAGLLLDRAGRLHAHRRHRARPRRTGSGLPATLFYLLAYGITTIGAFAVLTLVRDGDGEATHLSQWAGLAQRSPVTAGVMSIFLLSFAGIPLTSGFTAKFGAFRAAIEQGAWPLALVAVLTSAVAAFFYLRVIVLMYFSPAAAEGPTVGVPGLPTTLVLAVTATATVVLGVLPGSVLDLAGSAAISSARFVG